MTRLTITQSLYLVGIKKGAAMSDHVLQTRIRLMIFLITTDFQFIHITLNPNK